MALAALLRAPSDVAIHVVGPSNAAIRTAGRLLDTATPSRTHGRPKDVLGYLTEQVFVGKVEPVPRGWCTQTRE
ncbi:MAG: hypothetical protein EBZ98_01405 [Actinobacteria bacterium]|nr:hypothetical protein [Actinomycetota bacterium]